MMKTRKACAGLGSLYSDHPIEAFDQGNYPQRAITLKADYKKQRLRVNHPRGGINRALAGIHTQFSLRVPFSIFLIRA